MKKIAISLICALVASTTLTSCLPDGEETELTSTVALLSFSINDLKTRHTITPANGKDSTYTTIMAARNIRFTIDQAQGLVYNSDSIAYATDVTRVILNTAWSMTDLSVYINGANGETQAFALYTVANA